MSTVLKIVREQAALTFFMEIDVGGGLNCVQVYNDLFWRSSVQSDKFEQMRAAATIMAADNLLTIF